MADEPKSASTAAKSARASSAKNPPKNATAKAAPGDENSTTSDSGVQGSDAGSTSTRTDTTTLAQQDASQDSSQSTTAEDNANPGAEGTDSGATHGTSAAASDDRPLASYSSQGTSTSDEDPSSSGGTSDSRPVLGSGQRLAGGTDEDYPAQNSPRLSDPDGGSGDTPVQQFGAVGTLSPTRLSEENRVGDVDDDVKAAQFPTPRFNQGPPNVVVQSQVPPPYVGMYTQIDEDLMEVVYREGATTPSAKLVAPAGSFVRTDFLAEQMAHAVTDIAKAKAAQGSNPGDTDKADHRREVAQQ